MKRGVLGCVVALAIGCVVPAQAQEGELESTTLRLDRATFEELGAATVTVVPLGSAEPTKAGFRFPVLRATLAESAARIQNRGGIEFRSGAGAIKLKHFKVRFEALGAGGTLSARSAEGHVRVAKLQLTHVADDDDQLIPVRAKAELAADGAKALTDALGLEIEKGLELGKLRFR